ncbi:hypothetical protein ACFE04_030490 [Oxalis oulophora]
MKVEIKFLDRDFNDCDRDSASASDDCSDDDEVDGMEAANEEMIENLMRIPFNENSTERVCAICFVEFSQGEEIADSRLSYLVNKCGWIMCVNVIQAKRT